MECLLIEEMTLMKKKIKQLCLDINHEKSCKNLGLQYDVGVDNNNFYPLSFEDLKQIFEKIKPE